MNEIQQHLRLLYASSFKLTLHLLYAAIFTGLFLAIDSAYGYFFHSSYALDLSEKHKVNFLWYFPVFLLILSFCKPFIRNLILGALLFIVTIQLLHFQYWGAYILPIYIYQFFVEVIEVADTFFGEFQQYIGVFIFSALFCTLAYIINRQFKSHLYSSRFMPVALVIFLLPSFHATYHIVNKDLNPENKGKENIKLWHHDYKRIFPRPGATSLDNFYRSVRYFTVGILPEKVFGNLTSMEPPSPPKAIHKNIDANIILILGESLRAEQLSLLGYKTHATTPLLQKNNHIYAKPIYAAGTMTKTTVRSLFNRLQHPLMARKINNCLFRLAKNNNFKTHFISGPRLVFANALKPNLCSPYIDIFKSSEDFEEAYQKFDRPLLKYIDHVDFNQNNFIVLHMRGVHSPYKKRAPKAFKKFPNDYDNAVLYQDYLLNNIFNKIKERSKKPTYVIFTSDHGTIFKNENKEGRNGIGWFYPQIYRVPFIYMESNAGQKSFKKELKHVQSHFDLSSLLIKLFGYEAHINNSPERDIYINGTDIHALAGYLKIKIKNGQEVSKTIIR